MLSLRALQFLPEDRAAWQCRTSLYRRAAASAVSPLPGTRAPFTQWGENGPLGKSLAKVQGDQSVRAPCLG